MWFWRVIYVCNGQVETLLSEYGFPTPEDATKNYEQNFDIIASFLKFKGLTDVIEVSVIFISLSGNNGHKH